MQVIVLGASRAGLLLVRRLISAGHDVVLVDPNAENVASSKNISVITVTGVIIDIDILREAGIETADAVCALSESENQNLMASEIARDIFNVKHVITRIFDVHGLHIFDAAGFVTISSPELTVDAFMRELEDRDIEFQMDFNAHHIMGETVQFTLLQADGEVIGCKIREIEDTDARHVFGVIRNSRMILALPHMKIEKGDKLILASL